MTHSWLMEDEDIELLCLILYNAIMFSSTTNRSSVESYVRIQRGLATDLRDRIGLADTSHWKNVEIKKGAVTNGD